MARKWTEWTDGEYQYFVEESYRDVYNNLPSVPYLSDDTDEQARQLFAEGWLTAGLSPEQLDDIRQRFYDMIGIQESQFDWYDYRELYKEVSG